jgi:hypothetical protein
MSHYTWPTAMRYPEYQQAARLCLAENRQQAYLVSPPDFPLSNHPAPVKMEHLAPALRSWLTSPA